MQDAWQPLPLLQGTASGTSSPLPVSTPPSALVLPAHRQKLPAVVKQQWSTVCWGTVSCGDQQAAAWRLPLHCSMGSSTEHQQSSCLSPVIGYSRMKKRCTGCALILQRYWPMCSFVQHIKAAPFKSIFAHLMYECSATSTSRPHTYGMHNQSCF